MAIIDQDAIEQLLEPHGASGHRWIHPSDIAVASWVRMKCRYGCSAYGKQACCPPETPSVDECRAFFAEYDHALILHFARQFDDPEDRHAWTRELNTGLLEFERQVFLSGHHKAFLLFLDSCGLCEDCVGTRRACKEPARMRPSPEAFAVDVFATARKAGLPIAVLPDYDREMNRYAFLLVD